METQTQTFDKSAVERERFTDYLLEETVLDAIRVFEERSGHIVNEIKLKRHNHQWNVSLGLNSEPTSSNDKETK